MDHDSDITFSTNANLDIDFDTSEDIHQIECELDPQSILANEFSNQSLQVSDESNPIPETMGIENIWSQDECISSASTASNFPIPLPPPFPPSSSSDIFEGPENFTGDLGSLFDTPDESDVPDKGAQPGLCGIRNLGNTCFMSAGIQSLVATSGLVNYFNCIVSTTDEGKIFSSGSKGLLVNEFSSLLKRMWCGEFSIVHPSEFKQILGVHYPQFKDYRQHDCQEFLALLLDGLHEQLNTASIDVATKFQNGCDTLKDGQCTSTSLLLKNNNLMTSFNENMKDRTIVLSSPLKKEINIENKVNNELKTSIEETAITNCTTNNNFTYSNTNNNTTKETNLDTYNDNINTITSSFDLKDIMKDAKTSNVNVLVTEQDKNNDIKYDSDKFPRIKERRRDNEIININTLHSNNNENNGNNTNGKRNKNNTLQYSNNNEDTMSNEDGFSHLKRIKKTINEDINYNKNDTNFKETMKTESNDNNNFKNALNMFVDEKEKNFMMEINRKKQMEKNMRMECERKNNINIYVDKNINNGDICRRNQGDDNVMAIDDDDDDDDCRDGDGAVGVSNINDVQADKYWQTHLADNQSILVDLFQGQFKSTVVCSGCQFVSVTYEPFMYLSVPLPYAMEQQISVTYIPSNNESPIKCLVTVNKQDHVHHIKTNLFKQLNKPITNEGGGDTVETTEDNTKNIIIAEVLDHHIAKILEPNSLVRYVNDSNRQVYAFEQLIVNEQSIITNVVEENDDQMDTSVSLDTDQSKLEEDTICDDITNNPRPSLEEEGLLTSLEETDSVRTVGASGISLRCTICLEEKESNIKNHKNCSCNLCNDCVLDSLSHYNEDYPVSDNAFPCPVCQEKICPETDLISIENCIDDVKPTLRMINIPVVFRVDIIGDGNNKKSISLFGHPRLISVSNQISADILHRTIRSINPYKKSYKLLLVDGQGSHCSRCMFNEHCRGCVVATEGSISITLHNTDTLAVTFSEILEEQIVVNHYSLGSLRSQKPLTLYDCIKAFSESEILDEHNPWFCPKCENNQCATKTLSVCRYPEYLIVYLKRFVFHECMSIKLEDKVKFPTELTMSHCSYTYDLYACVCHIGGVSAGHYTAYTRHPYTGEWHYFNDETVLDQRPQEEDFNNAYVLFYKKRDDDSDSL